MKVEIDKLKYGYRIKYKKHNLIVNDIDIIEEIFKWAYEIDKSECLGMSYCLNQALRFETSDSAQTWKYCPRCGKEIK